MGVLSNKIRRDLLKSGDHIYSWRRGFLYAHHGIYDGKGNVIHFTQAAGRFLRSSSPSLSSDNPSRTSSNLHGIYVGEGRVIHFTRGAGRFLLSSSPSHSSGKPCPNCGDQSTLDGVISSCIDCFLSGGDLYRFQYGVNPAFFIAQARGGTCTLARADPPEDVLDRASLLLKNGFGSYDVFQNNCEDFAMYCKTGCIVFAMGRSGQAASFVAAATAVVSSPLRILTTGFTDLGVVGCGMGVLGCGMYCIRRFVSDIGVRRDVKKVPVERLITPCALDESVVATQVRKKE